MDMQHLPEIKKPYKEVAPVFITNRNMQHLLSITVQDLY